MPSSPRSEPVRTLLVEDDDDTAEATRRLLEHFGAQVVVAGTAADALTRMLQIRPELVLSDIYLPDGNGFELILQLRKLVPDLDPFCVAASGVGNVMGDARSTAARFDRFLQKPFESLTLRTLVEDVRSRRSAPPS